MPLIVVIEKNSNDAISGSREFYFDALGMICGKIAIIKLFHARMTTQGSINLFL